MTDFLLPGEEQRMQDGARAADPFASTARPDPLTSAAENLRVVGVKNPDQVAQARQISRSTGLPEDYIGRNPDRAKVEAMLARLKPTVETSPVLARSLANPDFAAIAHDDGENLGAVEKKVGPYKPVVTSADFDALVREVKQKNPTFDYDTARAIAATKVSVDNSEGGIKTSGGTAATASNIASGLWNSLVQGGERARAGARMQFADALGLDEMSKKAQRDYASAEFNQSINTPELGKVGKLVYGGAENVLQNIPLLTTAILTRNPWLAAAPAGVQTELDAYGKTRVRGGTGAESLASGVLQGAIEVGTEMLPMKFLVDRFGKTTLMRLFAGDQVREQLGEQIATHAQDAVDTAIANPNKTWGEYWKERPDAALQTAVAVLMQGALVSGAHGLAIRGRQAEIAAMDQQRMTELAALSQASRLRERDPQSFAQFVNEASTDGPVQDVYVSAQALQQAGINLESLANAVPSVAEQLPAAIASGTDIRMSIGDYSAHVAGVDAGNVLLQEIKTDPNGMSQREAQEFFQGQAEEFKAEAEKVIAQSAEADAWTQSKQNVETQVLDELNRIQRFTPDVNKSYAQLIASISTTMAHRLATSGVEQYKGMTPEKFAQTYLLKADSQQAVGTNALNEMPLASLTPEQAMQFAADTMANGGGSWNLVTGQSPTQGFAVAENKDREFVIDGPATPEALQQFVQQHQDLLSDPNYVLGTWYNAEDGKTYVDVTSVAPTLEDALQRGARAKQLAVWDFQNMQEIAVPADLAIAQVYEQAAKTTGNAELFKDITDALQMTPEEIAATALGLMTGFPGRDAFMSPQVKPMGIPEVVRFLDERRKASGLPVLDINKPEDRAQLARLMAAEALAHIRNAGDSLQWYDQTIRVMLNLMSVKYPELKTDPRARNAFLLAVAITSQGMNVETNLEFASKQYEAYRATVGPDGVGKFPVQGQGESAGAMAENFDKVNLALEEMGADMFRRFLVTPFTVRELKEAGFEVGGENMDTLVLGSAILGPKIGFGFYSNLNGNFEPVTMDMWFMRTEGRLAGTLPAFDPKLFAKQLARFRAGLTQKGRNGIFASQFDKDLVNRAKTDDAAAIELARLVEKAHEKDFKAQRAKYDAGKRVKSEIVNAATTMTKSLDAPTDSPSSGGERNLLRDVVAQAVALVQQHHGSPVPPAAFQALIWYPEQELYSALGVQLAVTSQDYAGAARKLLESEGHDVSQIGTPAVQPTEPGSGGVRPETPGGDAGATAGSDQESGRADAFQGSERTQFIREQNRRALWRPGDELTYKPEDVLTAETIKAAEEVAKPLRAAKAKAKKAEEKAEQAKAAGKKPRASKGAYVDPLAGREEERARANERLQPLVDKATADKPAFDALLDKIAEKLNGRAQHGPIKGLKRAAEKLILENNNDIAKMQDILRSTIVVRTQDEMQGAIDAIAKNFKIVRIKNRTNQKLTGPNLENKGPMPTGYADILMNVELPDGMIAEIQINVPEMLAAKGLGHEVYEVERALPEGDAEKNRLISLQAKLYAEAAVLLSSKATILAKASSLARDPNKNALPGLGNGLATGSNATALNPSGETATGTSSTSTKDQPSETSFFQSDISSTSDPTIAQNERPDYAPREPGEPLKAYMKRAIDTLPAPASLPYEPRKFFTFGPETIMVPVSAIQSTKSDEENQKGGSNAPKRFLAAYYGILTPREAIAVQPDGKGGYKVLDGNGTLTAFKNYGWPEIPVNVFPNMEAFEAHEAAQKAAPTNTLSQSAIQGVPEYGKTRPDGVDVVGIHFSKEPRTVLLGNKYGTGMKGAERDSVMAGDPALRERTFFYVNEGQGVQPESAVGGNAHATILRGLYDAAADPLKLWRQGGEKAVLEAGFPGYYARGSFGKQGTAVVFGSKGIPTSHVGGAQAANELVVNAKAPDPQFTEARILADQVMKNAMLPSGEMDLASWAKHIELADPEMFEKLADLGVFQRDLTKRYYKDEVVRLFYQDQNPRAQIAFGNDVSQTPSIISLFNNADLSSFIHEAGHFYLEVLAHIASQPNAPVEIAADFTRALKWFGVKDIATWKGMTLEQKRPFHEQWARGFEAYMFEGKAPATGLNGLFGRFRSWMIAVYREIKALNVSLTNEMRGVFDRMIATDEQIREAEQVRRMAPMFETKPPYMSDEEWRAYQETGREATEEAVSELQGKALRNMAWLSRLKAAAVSKITKEAAEKRKAIRREAEAEVRSEPLYAAQRFMSHGELPPNFETNNARRHVLESIQGKTKMSLAALKEMYGEGGAAPWRYFATGKNGMVTTEDGVHPDQIAELFGFTSGDQLVREILASDPERVAVDGLTDQRMLERHGEMADPIAVERAAEAAIHNEVRAKFIATELNALQRATGRKKILAKAARDFAAQIVGRVKVRDLKPAVYTAAETKSAAEAQAATKKGDLELAASLKRNQLINHYASKAAVDAVDDIEKIVRYLKTFERSSKRKGIGDVHLDQIDRLLERFEFKTVTLRELDQRATLAAWLENQREQGFDPEIPPELENEAARTNYKNLSVDQLRGLYDTVRQIEFLANVEKKLLTAHNAAEFAKVVAEISTSIDHHAGDKVAKLRRQDTLGDNAGKFANQWLAMHRKVASLARELDGFQDGGPFWKYIVKSMNAAGDREAQMRADATKDLIGLLKPILTGEKMGGKGQYFPTVGQSFNRQERIAMALNMGNDANKQRLLGGEGWTETQVKPILDTLTREDWAFVQSIWDYFETYRPQIGAKEKRIYGKEPKWVEATPVETPFGTLRGGYYPIKYDPGRSGKAEQHADAEEARGMLRGAYTSATTRRSFTKTRAEEVNDRPLKYDFSGITQGINEVIHDLTWHEWLIDVNRLLRAKPIDVAIRGHYGEEVFKALKQAVKDVAVGDQPAQNAFERAVNHIRHGATIAGLGWNVVTSLMQPLGLSQSMVRVGPKWVAKGLAAWMGGASHMEASTAAIYAKSTMMKLRAQTQQREIAELRNVVSGSKMSALENSYFYLIGKGQQLVDIPTWLGAYEKAIAEKRGEETAIALADQAVLDSQGGGQIKDLSQVQRGGPLMKLFTNFYSFFNTTYNLAVERGKATDFKNPADVGKLAVDYLLLFTVPAVLSALLKMALKGDDDDPEKIARKLAAEQISYLMGTMVGVRELGGLAQAISGKKAPDYTGPAGLRLISELTKLSQQIGQGEVDKALVKAAASSAGILFHLPAGQVEKTIEGVIALSDGKTQNPGALLAGPGK